MILVSVIIPYFKKKNYIQKTLNSVSNQTYKNLEILIIYDDKDTADLKFLKKLQKKDKRIKIIINKNTLGAGLSRNVGIKDAKGKYIAFIDSDDLWKKNKIKFQLKFMLKNDLKICHSAYEVIDLKNEIKNVRKSKTYSNYNQLLKSCDIGLSSVVLEKNVVIQNQIKFPKLATKEDFVFWLMILKKNYKFHALDKYLTNWTDLENSLSSSTIQKLKDGFKVYNQYMNFNIIKSLYYLICLSINYLKKK